MRIWVSRPEPAAGRTAERLRGLGHDPLVAPVLHVEPTGAAPPPCPTGGRFDGIVVTSANAVAPLAAAGLGTIPVFAVGRRTAERAATLGLGPVHTARGDAAALAALVGERLAPGAALLHAAGTDRKPEPEATLAARGYALTVWIAYAAKPVATLPEPVARALGAASLDGALHYSRRSAQIALALARAAGREGAFLRLTHYCLSADVAVPLVAAGVAAHFVAARPDEDALLAGLTDRTDGSLSPRPAPRC